MLAAAFLERLRHSMISWLGLFLIAFNVIVGAMLPPRTVEAASFTQDGKIVVCTAAGMMLIDLKGDQSPSDHAPAHDRLCVFCLPLMHGGLDVPAAAASTEPVAIPYAISLPVSSQSAPPFHFTGITFPRAPPSL